jgi:hypothetical protein
MHGAAAAAPDGAAELNRVRAIIDQALEQQLAGRTGARRLTVRRARKAAGMQRPGRRAWQFSPQRALIAAFGGVVAGTGPGYLPAHSPELYAAGGLGLLVAAGAALLSRRPAAGGGKPVSHVPATAEEQ